MKTCWGIIVATAFAMASAYADDVSVSTTAVASERRALLSAYEGPTFEVAVWRGEMAYAPVPERFAAEILPCDGVEENGMKLELFSVGGVDFRTEACGTLLARRLDVVAPCRVSGGLPALCKVSVRADAKPRRYVFGPLVVRVVDHVLPPPGEWHYFLDLWQHPWAVARYFNLAPFSKEHYAAMEPVFRTLAECGAKSLTVTLLDLPWNHQCYDAYHSMIGRTRREDGTWAFDYAVFDEYVKFGRRCGIGPDIACYTMCPWGYAVRWRDEAGATIQTEAKPGTAAFEDCWGGFLEDFAVHLKEKGWFDDAYVAMDERSPEDVRQIVEFVRRRVPGMKIAMAGNKKPSAFGGIRIDNYSQYLGHMTDEFLAEIPERRATGCRTTFYVCCDPARPNTFMDSGNGEAFWLGAYPAFSGLDGFLRWAANSWPRDPYVDASFGNWRAGDTFLVYPKGEPSARLVALRAGIVAAEKMRILGDAANLSGLQDFYDCRKAMSGAVDFDACRKLTEKGVNND